jgi:hypothetical protein
MTLRTIIAICLVAAPALSYAQQEQISQSVTYLGYESSCGTAQCASLRCDAGYNITDDDVKCYALRAFQNGQSCVDAANKTPVRLTRHKKRLIADLYESADQSEACLFPAPIVRGAVDSSIWRSPRGFFHQWWGLQVLPTFSVGIPFGLSDEDDIGKALGDVSAMGGIVLRLSPVSHWVSGRVAIGTTSVKTSSLDPMTYADPSIVMYGAGADLIGGLLGATVWRAELRRDGLTSKSMDSALFFSIQIDLTSAGLLLAGLTK